MTSTTGGSSYVDIPVPTSTVGSFVYSLVSVQESSASACSNTATGSATITVNALPTVVSVSPSTPAVCLGTLSFAETLTTTQNPDQYKITWSAAAIAQGFTDVTYAANNLPLSGTITIAIPATAVAGTYSGTLVIKNSTTTCESDPGSAFLVINPLPTITGVSSLCTSANITLTGSGTPDGTTPWASSNTGVATVSSLGVVSGVSAGTVTITYKDNNTCLQTKSVTVNPLPTATITPVGLTTVCAGEPVTLTAGGGTSYLWSTGSNQSTISVVSSGSITVTATDGNGCKGTSSATSVTVNPLPTATITPVGLTTVCAGEPVTLTAGGGTSYLWSTGSNQSTISVVSSGSITVTATDGNGCKGTSSATSVTVNPLPTATITPVGLTTVCAGEPVTLTAGGGISYLWSTGSNQSTISVVSSGSITVTATDGNGCKGTSSATSVTVNPLPTATITPVGLTTVCAGEPVTLTAGGGTSYLWSTGSNQSTISVASSGSITVTATDGNGCKGTSSATSVTVNPLPTATITPVGLTTVCAGEPVTLTAGGGTSYLWSTGSTLSAISVASSGSITVTATDGNGCKGTSSVTSVTVNPLPTATITAGGLTTVCAGETVTLTAGGGTSYLWSTGSTLSAISVASSGSITVTATDGNGCKNTSSITSITVNPLPSITAPSAVCVGTPTLLTGFGIAAATAPWQSSNPLIASMSAAGVLTGLLGGSVGITYTDDKGCRQTQTVQINGLPNAAINPDGPLSFCSGASVNLSASGGLSYTWNTGASTSVIAVTSSGTFTVTATDGNGCKGTSTATVVTVNALPNAAITADGPTVFCAGASVNLTASAGAAYLWSDGQTTRTIRVTSSATPSVKVTDANGCSATSVATTVTVNSLPVANITANGPVVFCTGGSVTLTSTAGNSYLWSTGATTRSITVTGSATPSVRVTDANGCSASSAAANVVVNPLPVVTINNGDPVAFCSGGSANLTASSGASYLWSNGATTRSINVTTAGPRSVRVTDANGCSASSVATDVVVNPLPVATISPAGSTSICAGSSVTLTAGAASSYVWSTGATTRSISTSTSLNASVRVTDANGCSATSAETRVTVNPLPVMVITDPAAVCAPATVDLTLGAVTAGSTAGTVFTYFTDAATTKPFTTPAAVGVAGTYYIKGTLPTGCSSSKAVSVVIADPPVITIQGPAAVCAPATVDLTAPAVTQGSTAGLQYAYFTDALLTSAVSNPAAINTSGTYYIKGSVPGTSCSAAMPVSVVINPQPTGVLQTPSVNYVCSGSSLELRASGADAYQWLLNQQPVSGATAAGFAATTAGVYSVKFISNEGCVKEASNPVRLEVLVKPVLRFQPDSRCAGSPASFSNYSAYANSGGINWSWDFGDGSQSAAFSPVHTYSSGGNYSVTLTANNLSCPTLTESLTTTYYIDSARVPVRYPTINAVAGKAFVLAARSLGALYRWQPATGLNSTTVQYPTAVLNQDQEYTVTITNSASCTTTDTVAVKLVFDGDIFVGNGFTPNGDGVNDRCYPILSGIRTLVYFKIYNRWGNLVFQTNDASPQNGWNGTYNGRMQPSGTYIWVAEAVDGRGVSVKRSGNVLLIN